MRKFSDVFVTGSNRGIGLEFTKQYLHEGARVFAATRKTGDENLRALGAEFPERLVICALDVADPASFEYCYQFVAERTAKLDLFINNAGACFRKEPLTFTYDELVRTMNVNVVGPIFAVKVFLPLLKASSNPLVVNISSYFASIAEQEKNQTGDSAENGPLGYCASKAALNMASVKLHNQLKEFGITVIAQAPGWVKTEMGTERAPMQAHEAVQGMRHIFQGIQDPPVGRFAEWDGSLLPW